MPHEMNANPYGMGMPPAPMPGPPMGAAPMPRPDPMMDMGQMHPGPEIPEPEVMLPPGPPPEPVRSDVKWCPCPGNGARSEIDDSLCSEIGGQAYEDADGKKFCAVVPPGVFAPLPAGSKRLNR